MSALQLKGRVCTLLEGTHLLHAGGACLKKAGEAICLYRDEGLCQYFARKGVTVMEGRVCTVLDGVCLYRD
jgi:hypothetical protein